MIVDRRQSLVTPGNKKLTIKNNLMLPSTKPRKFLLQTFPRSLLILFVLFSACTVKLAPSYDQGIVDNLGNASADVFELLSEVSEGTTKASFDTRAGKYNKLIGGLEALIMNIEARPVPDNKTVNKIIAKANKHLSKDSSATTITAGSRPPSANALEQIIANLKMMKTTDQSEGLNPTQVKAFKGNIKLFMDQALTYERYLKQE